jgi:microcystin-dependent protein
MAQVADYDIANASGASVRSDLNAVFEAIKTLNSGGTDPANPLAFMPYVDTADNNNLKIRNASNNGFTTVGSVDDANLGLLPKSGGIMTGQIQGAAGGGAGIPEYSFVNDTDTGMFRSGANQVAFTCAGNHAVDIHPSGITIRADASGSNRTLRLADGDNSHHVALGAPQAVSANITYTLPAAPTNGGFLQTDGSGNLSFQIVAGVPTGSVFCMAVATVPSGYLECNGQTLSRSTYAALFAIIGTQYGAPSGSTFKVPDLRGEFIRGFDNGRGVNPNRSIGSLEGDDNKLHNHGIDFYTQNHTLTGTVANISESYEVSGTASGVFSKGAGSAARTPITSDVSGAGSFSFNGTHNHHVIGATQNSGGDGIQGESRPRNIAMMYIIKI